MTQASQHIGKGYSAIEILLMIMNSNDSTDFHLDERIWHSSQNEATFSKGHHGEKMPEDVEQSLVSESGY
ncbi:hypothetical protein CDAR_295511 [Caerostris darwini]|uniref:Uncharacterized protein n=1 Tax=Caerostris darwini TaxID=1538125 RepID=A0AAV4NE48_9ARAC|nr:hypothetical protein CDAR_295511 [Caerostris darwini]